MKTIVEKQQYDKCCGCGNVQKRESNFCTECGFDQVRELSRKELAKMAKEKREE